MLEEDKYYVGDIGTLVLVDIGTDITLATECAIYVKKPNGTRVTWVASISGEEEIQYIIQDGDWDLPGIYTIQSYIVTPSWSGRGTTATFTVYSDFK